MVERLILVMVYHFQKFPSILDGSVSGIEPLDNSTEHIVSDRVPSQI